MDFLELCWLRQIFAFNACNASFNAEIDAFTQTKYLICYFHVIFNCRKRYLSHSKEKKNHNSSRKIKIIQSHLNQHLRPTPLKD
ncbi:hypothetical protein BpHYR1_032313 [Brachionus plicatilis]|uniref:MULE transposase domain-containing protein n=1 Tax=Brachionus plicatilis TaxID=10195 RepID=A0A3M7RB14_BRAPC|nr:hypothetical protein BpHYR1_032313 [Brachionus plicatilis]